MTGWTLHFKRDVSQPKTRAASLPFERRAPHFGAPELSGLSSVRTAPTSENFGYLRIAFSTPYSVPQNPKLSPKLDRTCLPSSLSHHYPQTYRNAQSIGAWSALSDAWSALSCAFLDSSSSSVSGMSAADTKPVPADGGLQSTRQSQLYQKRST